MVEDLARTMGREPSEMWAWLYRQAVPPPEIRAALVEAFFPRVRPDDFLLPSQAENATLATMTATEFLPVRKGRPIAHRDHPFVAAMLRGRLTIAEVGKMVKRPPSTVKSWYQEPGTTSYRPIPMAAAKVLRDRLKVPLSAWPRISE